MSKLVFREMQKGNAADLAQVVDYFGHDAREFFEQGFRYIIGYRDSEPIIGATTDASYSEIFVETNEGTEAYSAMLTEIERLARGVGAASIKTGVSALEDCPEFQASCIANGFEGEIAGDMWKVLDRQKFDQEREQVRLDIANAELLESEV